MLHYLSILLLLKPVALEENGVKKINKYPKYFRAAKPSSVFSQQDPQQPCPACSQRGINSQPSFLSTLLWPKPRCTLNYEKDKRKQPQEKKQRYQCLKWDGLRMGCSELSTVLVPYTPPWNRKKGDCNISTTPAFSYSHCFCREYYRNPQRREPTPVRSERVLSKTGGFKGWFY